MFKIAEIIMKFTCETKLNKKVDKELSYIVNQC